MSILNNWPRIVFILVPLLILSVDAVVLIGERMEPQQEKAIRLVKESSSRKENFTVQQYLYTTVYHRMSRGETVRIEGWRTSGSDSDPMMVEFSYVDLEGAHVAIWEADFKHRKVTPRNEAALALSWH